MKYLKPRTRAEVEWNDAHSSLDPIIMDDLDSFHAPFPQLSIGYVRRHDKTGITLAGCIGVSDEDTDRCLFIPAGMVVTVKVLK